MEGLAHRTIEELDDRSAWSSVTQDHSSRVPRRWGHALTLTLRVEHESQAFLSRVLASAALGVPLTWSAP